MNLTITPVENHRIYFWGGLAVFLYVFFYIAMEGLNPPRRLVNLASIIIAGSISIQLLIFHLVPLLKRRVDVLYLIYAGIIVTHLAVFNVLFYFNYLEFVLFLLVLSVCNLMLMVEQYTLKVSVLFLGYTLLCAALAVIFCPVYNLEPLFILAAVLGIQVPAFFVFRMQARTRDRLWREKHRYRSIVENSLEGIITVTGDTISYVNPAAARMLKTSQSSAAGKAINQILPRLTGQELAEVGGVKIYNSQELATSAGQRLLVNMNVFPKGTGQHDEQTYFFQDISQEAEHRRQIEHLAHYDSLTNLLNRASFHTHVKAQLERTHRYGEIAAVLLLDLDHFKEINDTMGHAAGDAVLIEVAARLEKTVRTSDKVFRLGGDEFVILLSRVAAASHAAVVAEKINRILEEPFEYDENSIQMGCSIGICICTDDAEINAEEILRRSDLAMYDAKRNHIGYQFYQKEMHDQAVEKMKMTARMRQALDEDSFVLHYQPKYAAATKSIASLEALLRWDDPETGPVSPADFIPVAEETGLIIDLGRWVFRQVCQQLRKWADGDLAPVPISVNFSDKQFQHPGLADMLSQAIADFQVDPKLLTIEITETVTINSLRDAQTIIKRIHDLGITVSIDDFGTGNSAINLLRHLPVDILKIDKSFVRGIEGNATESQLVELIIRTAHIMNMKVVAEGVETDKEASTLIDLGADYLQGYYYARPAAANIIAGMLLDQKIAHQENETPFPFKSAP